MKEIKNKYKCSPKIWSKFSQPEKKIYNILRPLFKNSDLYPKGLTKKELEVVSHNTSCVMVWEMPQLFKEAIKK